MRATLDHSWNLFDDNERSTLARLSVFRGGCEREAATSITGTTLLTITALIDKSLLRSETVDGATRYYLHELVRQYAAERLADDYQDQGATEERHTFYYAAFLSRSIDGRTGDSTPEARLVLARNIDNLRLACARAVDTRNAGALGMMLRGFWILYDDHGWLHDGMTLYGHAAAALRDEGGPAVAVRGYLLGLHGYFLTRIARYEAAQVHVQEALALLRASGATDHLEAMLIFYGVSLFHLGRLAEAFEHFAQASTGARANDDHFLQFWADIWLAVINTFWGNYHAVDESITAYLTTFWGQGYNRGESVVLGALGELARRRGKLDEADSYLQEGLRIASAANDTLTTSICLCQIGAVALQRGELDPARYLLMECAALAREMGDRWHVGRSLTFLVQVEIGRGDLEAARLACAELARIAVAGESVLLGDAIFGFVALLHHSGNDADAWALLQRLDSIEANVEIKHAAENLRVNLEQRLGADQRAAAIEMPQRELNPWLKGLSTRAYTTTNTVSESVSRPIPPGSFFVVETGETLSSREVDVLRLIASGANNALIAEHLIISRHTVKTHVAHILAKLNVASRTAAAVRAQELGLT